MKKKILKEKEELNDKWTKSDADEIRRLYKVVVAQQSDLDSIYNLYKKYIVPNATMYQVNCQCATSISRYYSTLLDWFSKNSSNFGDK